MKKLRKVLLASVLTLAVALPAYASCIRVTVCDAAGNCQAAWYCCNASGMSCWLWFQEK